MEYRRKASTMQTLLRIVLIVFVISIVVWYFYMKDMPRLDPTAVPRAVTARGDLAADEKTTIDIFQSVSKSVVYITSVELRRDFFSLNVYEIPRGTGSGFIWDTEGRIVTNYHVIEDASRLEVTLADHTKWKAVIIGVAPDKDLAVLQISAPSAKLIPIPVGESKDLMVGQNVFAIGNPFGLDQTMTTGIVSALGREIKAVTGRTIEGVIQTDAAINPGNSGGPLLDSAGLLIGVNTAIYSPSGASAGIGFAVPVEVVNRFVPQIIKYGRVVRLGIGIGIANDRIARQLGLEGVLIVRVQAGSSAETAGLKGTYRSAEGILLGDIIVGVDGQKVKDSDDLLNAFEKHKVGDMVDLDIIRDDREMTVAVRLEALTGD
jgi:S1-C subfamily serine protease